MSSKPDPLNLPFPVVRFSLDYKDRSFRFVYPADHDAVIDAIAEEEYEKDRFLPYWAERWPSATVLFHFVMKHRLPVHYRIIELGCGLGVIASALAARHHCTVATDISPDGCRFAAHNIAANNGIPLVVCADWRYPPFRKRFDIVLASDVLYEKRWIDPVLDFIERLCRAEGMAWIADPCRRFWALFKQRIAERGLRHRLLHRSPVNGDTPVVEIIEITGRTGPDTAG
jgi:predicted nicotinamide N-methyase